MKLFVCLAMWSVTSVTAATSAFLLGVDYSEWININPIQIATDSSGSLYLLSEAPGTGYGLVTKLSADGKTILWQSLPGFGVDAMAVDPGGDVFVMPATQAGDTSFYIAKLNAGGSGVLWKTPVGFISFGGAIPVLAADLQGRAYLAAQYDLTNNTLEVVRLNAGGSATDYTAQLTGTPTAIAVNSSGAAYVAGYKAIYTGPVAGFLAQLAPDGSAGFYTILPGDSYPAVALDAEGNAVVAGLGVLQHIDSTGAITLSTTVPGGPEYFALDAAGNAYLTGRTTSLFQVTNSLTTCGWNASAAPGDAAGFLTVVAPDGSVPQSTYIPGSEFSTGNPLVATGPNSTVFVAATASASFAPTQAGPFPAGASGSSFLLRFSPQADAPIVPLACLVNGASFEAGAVAPGEIVTLFGTGLGPLQGVEPKATPQSPFPALAAGVEVTFDGTPAPLLWVQNLQINAVAPWSLTPSKNTQVCVSYSLKTNCLTWPVAQAAPAVFTVDGVYAATVNQDGTINSANNPAPLGSIVSVWATGLGPITPPQADGTLVGFPLPTDIVAAGAEAVYQIIGIPSTIVETEPFVIKYAGPAPGMVAGTSQLNFVVEAYPSYGGIFVTLPSAQSPGFEVYIAGQ